MAIIFDDLTALVARPQLLGAINEDPDAADLDPEAWAAFAAAVAKRVADALGESPSAEQVAAARFAELVFGADLAYLRRGVAPRDNPWHDQALDQERRLRRLGSGEESVAADDGGTAIVEDSAFKGLGRRVMA